MEIKKNLLTQKEKEKIERDLKNLIEVQRPMVIEQLKEARAQGDLSENAEYDNARNSQAEVEAKIQELEAILDNYEIIEVNKIKNIVKLGAKVLIEESSFDGKSKKREESYEIVGQIEADPFKNKISNESPLGKAIIGKKVGDIVSITGIESSYRVKIIKIN